MLKRIGEAIKRNKEDIKTLLLSGSLEQLQDCLDFAPSGVIDLVKDYAVKLEINDISKRNAILTATGFNVTRAIFISLFYFTVAHNTYGIILQQKTS